MVIGWCGFEFVVVACLGALRWDLCLRVWMGLCNSGWVGGAIYYGIYVLGGVCVVCRRCGCGLGDLENGW